jgi:hypothetical protein
MLASLAQRQVPSAEVAGPATRNDEFLALLPRIRRHAQIQFRQLRGDDHDDALAEVTANAFVAYARLNETGRRSVAHWSTLAAFAIAHTRAGRKVGSRLNSNDVLSSYAQRRRGLQVQRIDSAVANDGGWRAMVLEDRRSSPAEIACFRLDFAQWLGSLSHHKRRIALALAQGETTGAAAKAFRVSPARISQLRRELAESWKSFQQGKESG